MDEVSGRDGGRDGPQTQAGEMGRNVPSRGTDAQGAVREPDDGRPRIHTWPQ